MDQTRIERALREHLVKGDARELGSLHRPDEIVA